MAARVGRRARRLAMVWWLGLRRWGSLLASMQG